MELSILILFGHIAAGITSLITGVIATLIKVFNLKHKWHLKFGKAFFYAMMIVAVSAIPLSFFSNNLFLLLIALFSGYLAHGGWRFGNNKTKEMRQIDKISMALAGLVGVAMCVYALFMLLIQGDSQGITLGVFGIIMIGFSIREKGLFKETPLSYNQRIAAHLSFMLGATIASFTAFLVTNLSFDPAFILWLAPTVAITPLIAFWNIKLLSNSGTS